MICLYAYNVDLITLIWWSDKNHVEDGDEDDDDDHDYDHGYVIYIFTSMRSLLKKEYYRRPKQSKNIRK